MKICHWDKTLSIWYNFAIVMKFFTMMEILSLWNIIYHCDKKKSSLRWRFIIVINAYRLD